MDLLLWRNAHARDALPGESDMDRPLTDKGRRQSEKIAHWLNQQMPDNTLVLCSPAVRTVQTVQALGRPYQLCEQIRPDSSAQSLITASQWPDSPRPVLLVSHQPFLSQAVSQLLGLPVNIPLSFRKGSLWWLRSTGEKTGGRAQLLTLQDAEFL